MKINFTDEWCLAAADRETGEVGAGASFLHPSRRTIKLKRYCVTVMDHWTPTREFFTYAAAKRWQDKHNITSAKPAHLWVWTPKQWVEVI